MTELSFLNPYSVRVLEALLQNPAYLREIAEKTRLPPSTTFNAVSTLLENDILESRKNKNKKIFSINFASPVACKLVSLLVISKITHAKAFQRLINLKPKSIALFGSASTGKMAPDSDIDLAIVFERKIDPFKISRLKQELSDELNRKIDLVTLTPEKISEMKKNQIELLNRIQYGSNLLRGTPIETNS